MNIKGVESSLISFEVYYKPESIVKPDLHVISIGVSNFKNTDYNLTYAGKDAEDIVRMLEDDHESFENINVHLLTNENATTDNILNLRKALENTAVNDQVVMFVASHGVLDYDMDYYIATHDIDFDNPKHQGLKYNDLEGLMDGIPARKKLLLLDACHSGEIDKDESELGQTKSLATFA